MNFNDLTPEQKRERIEQVLSNLKLTSPGENIVLSTAMCQWLCKLALRGLPPRVGWREILPNKEFQFLWGAWVLRVFNENGWWNWQIDCNDRTVAGNDKSVRNPEAARATAEDALTKLVGGEG